MPETATLEPITTDTPKVAKKPRKAKTKGKAAKVESKVKEKGILRLPQFRVLKAMTPTADGDKPFFTRARLEKKAGFNVGSGTLSVALAGRKIGDKSIPGLIDLGLIKRTEIELDGGAKEVGYQITAKGIKAVETFLAEHGKAPKTRDKSLCVNKRYKGK